MFNFDKIKSSIKNKFPSKEQERGVSVEDLYSRYLSGQVGQEDLFRLLTPENIPEFTSLHEKKKAEFQNKNDRRLVFKLNQIDNLISKGLEKLVREANGEPVIEKWN